MPASLQVNIDSERSEVKPPQVEPRQPSSTDTDFIRNSLKAIYGGWYSRPIGLSIGVSHRTVQDWFYKKRISAAGERKLLAHVNRMIEHLRYVEMALTAEIDGRAKKPKRHTGFLAVKDHGDGLPPHNQVSQVLTQLGIYSGKPIGVRKSVNEQQVTR
jgi:hypothetical protein